MVFEKNGNFFALHCQKMQKIVIITSTRYKAWFTRTAKTDPFCEKTDGQRRKIEKEDFNA
jgi:hypothetical protein